MKNNFFKDKNILIFKKKKKSFYYDDIIKNIIFYGKPKKIIYVKYSGFGNIVGINEKILNKIKNTKIDIFIATSYFPFNTNYLNYIKTICTSIRIEGDDDNLLKSYSIHISKYFDLNITLSPSAADLLNKYNYTSIAIPVFYSLEKVTIKKKKYDVSFVGLLRGKEDREANISEIIKNKISIKIFGPDTNKIPYSKVLKIFKLSKINLNFSKLNNDIWILNKHNKLLNRIKSMKSRIYEVIRVGGFVLTEYSPDIKRFFNINKDLVVFRNKLELISKIKFFLKNEKKRELIAKEGKKSYDKKFSKEAYAKNFIILITKILRKNENKKNKIVSKQYEVNYAEFFSYFVNLKDLIKIITLKNDYIYLLKYKIFLLRIIKKLRIFKFDRLLS